MYRVKVKNVIEKAYICKIKDTGVKWHRKLGHPGNARMKFLENIDENFSVPEDKCEIWILGKHPKISYKRKRRNKSNKPLELIHSDVNEPMPEVSLGGHRYFVSFIDDYSKKVFLYPMKMKNKVYQKLLEFKNLIENQLNRKIKAFRSDNGTEFVNKQIQELFESNGIVHQKSIPYTPQQNGVVERYNRTIMDKVRCMLLNSKLDDKFWAEYFT